MPKEKDRSAKSEKKKDAHKSREGHRQSKSHKSSHDFRRKSHESSRKHSQDASRRSHEHGHSSRDKTGKTSHGIHESHHGGGRKTALHEHAHRSHDPEHKSHDHKIGSARKDNTDSSQSKPAKTSTESRARAHVGTRVYPKSHDVKKRLDHGDSGHAHREFGVHRNKPVDKMTSVTTSPPKEVADKSGRRENARDEEEVHMDVKPTRHRHVVHKEKKLYNVIHSQRHVTPRAHGDYSPRSSRSRSRSKSKSPNINRKGIKV